MFVSFKPRDKAGCGYGYWGKELFLDDLKSGGGAGGDQGASA